MKPMLNLFVSPDQNSDYSRVTLVAALLDQQSIWHDVILYDQLRLVQPLEEHTGAELWAVTTLANISSAIEAALHAQIAQGALTLMADLGKH